MSYPGGLTIFFLTVCRRFNNPDKGAVTHAIVHRVLWEYLFAVNDTPEEAERDKLRREIFETFVLFLEFPRYFCGSERSLCSCQDVLAEMVHTKDGSRVVREFIAQGSAKVSRELPFSFLSCVHG